MTFSEIISSFGLAAFPIMAMPVFILVFVAISIRSMARSRRAEHARAAALPLDDD